MGGHYNSHRINCTALGTTKPYEKIYLSVMISYKCVTTLIRTTVPIGVMLRPTRHLTVLCLVHVWLRAARSFTGLKVVFFLRLVLTTVECGIRGRDLHGLNLRLLLV